MMFTIHMSMRVESHVVTSFFFFLSTASINNIQCVEFDCSHMDNWRLHQDGFALKLNS